MLVLMRACVTCSGFGSWFYLEQTAQDFASVLAFSVVYALVQPLGTSVMSMQLGRTWV